MSIQDQPLQLVYRNSDGQLEISQIAKNYLSSLKEKQLGVLSIIGPYKAGKSCLINQLFIKEEVNQFKTCPTVNQCTKGLWIHPKLLESESGQKFIIIDSEGFGSLDQSENSDNKLMFLNLLLSSVLIFNTIGPIEEKSLNQLFNVLKLVKQLQIQVPNEKNLSQELPFFMWALRDFSLALEDQMGEIINTKQYLENALEEQKGLSEATMQKNMVRKLFKHFFSERDCMSIVRPIEEELQLQNLSSIPLEQYRQEYLQDISKLHKKLLKRMKVKVFNNRNITGSMLVFLLERYVNAINNGIIPNLVKIQEQFNEFIMNDINKQCTNIIEQNIKLKENQQLVSQQELLQLITSTKQKIIQICENEQVSKDAILIMFEKQIKQFKELNSKLYQQQFEERMQKTQQEIKNSIIEGDSGIILLWEQIKNEITSQFGEISDIVLDSKSKFLEVAYKQYFEQQKRYWQKQYEAESLKQERQFETKLANLEERRLLIERQLNESDCLLKQQKEFTNDLNEKLKKSQQELDERQQNYDQQIKQLISKIDNMKDYQDYVRLENELRDLKVEFEVMESKSQQKREMLNQEIQYLKNDKIQLQDANNHLKALYAESQERFREKEIIVASNANTIVSLQNEIRMLNEQLKISEEKLKETTQVYQTEINSLKIGTEKKMKEIKQSAEELNEVVINKKSEQWERDKQLFESQLQFLKLQLQDNKAINEQLIQALNLGRTQSASQAEMQFQSYQELMESNKQLLQIINQQENKMQLLQNKIDSLKIFKSIVKQSAGFNCKLCSIYCDIDNFQNHLNVCSIGAHPFGEAMRSQIRQNQLNNSIEKQGILSNAAEYSNKKQKSSSKWNSRGGSQTRNHSRSIENGDQRLNKSLVLNSSYLKNSTTINQKCNTSINLANTSQQSMDDSTEINCLFPNTRLSQDFKIMKRNRLYSPLNNIEMQHGQISTKNGQGGQRLNQSSMYQTPSHQNQLNLSIQIERNQDISNNQDFKQNNQNYQQFLNCQQGYCDQVLINQDIEQPPYPQLNQGEFSIDILQTLISQEENGKPYSLYEISIKMFNEGKNWNVFKKYKDFHELHQRLQTYFKKSKNISQQDRNTFAEVSFIDALSQLNNEMLKSENENSQQSVQSNSILEKRAQNIQQYLQMIIQVQAIRTSPIFQDFFQFSRQSPQNEEKVDSQIPVQHDNQNQMNTYRFNLSINQSHIDEKNNSVNNENFNFKDQEMSGRSLSLSQSPTKKEKSTIRTVQQESVDNGIHNNSSQHTHLNHFYNVNTAQRNTLDNIFMGNNLPNQIQQQQPQLINQQPYKNLAEACSNIGKENKIHGVRKDRVSSTGNAFINQQPLLQSKISVNRQQQTPQNQSYNKFMNRSPLIKQNNYPQAYQSFHQQRNLSIDCSNSNINGSEITSQNNLQQNTNKSLKSEIQERIKKNCKLQNGNFLKKQ